MKRLVGNTSGNNTSKRVPKPGTADGNSGDAIHAAKSSDVAQSNDAAQGGVEKPRPSAIGLVIALLALILAFILYRFHIYDGTNALAWRVPIDLRIYQLGGREIETHQQLYDDPLYGRLPFTYPPIAAAIFTALAHFGDNALIAFWQGGMAVALFGVVYMVARERGLSRSFSTILFSALFTACMLAVEPAHGTLYFGQINIFLMFLVALDILPRGQQALAEDLPHSDRRLQGLRRLPGVGIGIAAGLKLTPAYMGIILVAERRWKALAGAVATFAATVAVGFLFVSDAKEFWTNSIFNSSRVGTHSNPGAQSLRSVLERELGVTSTGVWLAVCLVVLALTALALRTAIQKDNRSMALALTGISSCLVSPFAWYHHWVWVVPLAAAILIDTNRWVAARLGGPAATRPLHAMSSTPAEPSTPAVPSAPTKPSPFTEPSMPVVQSRPAKSSAAPVAAIASVTAAALALFPFLSAPFAFGLSAWSLRDHDALQPWGSLLFTGAGVLFIAGYAALGLRRDPTPQALRRESRQDFDHN